MVGNGLRGLVLLVVRVDIGYISVIALIKILQVEFGVLGKCFEAFDTHIV